MSILLAFCTGILVACGLYLMMRRSIVKLVIGLILLSNAANLTIFVAAGLTRGAPPLVPLGAMVPPAGTADPLPQALVLTAIVIGFGVLAFCLVMVARAHRAIGTDDIDRLQSTDT